MTRKIQIARLLRQDQTPAENLLWKFLRNRRFLNLKFRRQHPIKEYIVDFCCPEKQIIIELDGKYHLKGEQKEKDSLRDLHLKNLGYEILRYSNEVVFNNKKTIFKDIEKAANRLIYNPHFSKNETHPQPSLLPQGGRSKTILSTKKLKPNQKALLLNAGIGFVEQNFISIVPLDFEIENLPENIIFTSKNSVRIVLQKINAEVLKTKNIFCVGEKTANLLAEKGLKVRKFTYYGANLAHKLAKTHKNERFLFFCGKKKRPELPEIFNLNKIALTEVEVYDTVATPKKINRNFDGVLFFSPSAVESFCKENKLEESVAFCIGTTTASEAKRYTDKIITANKPSIENVIVQVVKYFNQQAQHKN